jgi:hypothetical protein
MHLAVCRDGHALQLQEELQQRAASTRDLPEAVDCRVKFEVRRLASIKSGLRGLTLLSHEMQPVEYGLNYPDLIPRYHPICLAERAHDGKGRFEQLRLHYLQPAEQLVSQASTDEVAKCRTNQETREAADQIA